MSIPDPPVRRALAVAFVVLLGLAGCGRFSMQHYRQAVQSGRQKIPAVGEMERLFPGQVQNFIGSNGGTTSQTMTWNSEVLLYDRYVLTMQVPVKVNGSFSEVTAVVGKPKFWIHEVVKVERDTPKTWGATIGKNWDFGADDWSKVVAHHGDFSTIGIDLLKNQPVKNFQAMYQEYRRQREPPP